MRKYFFLTLSIVIGFNAIVAAQTLLTYGNDSVTVQEFLKAYNKNNAASVKDVPAMQNYLELFIASRLKIKEAKQRGYDTLPQLVSDLYDLREQIIPSYLVDVSGTEALVNEALLRSQKDIHLAHIFIASAGNSDTATTRKKAEEAYKKLQSGESFSIIASQYSDDPSAKSNGGDVGYVTAFTLPYVLENLIYTTPAGNLSPIYRSNAGYHIFKNLGERKSLGRIRAAQILLGFPPDATEAVKAQAKKTIDSLYNRLLKGDDFGKLAAQFSNDVVSAASNGQLQEFGIGQYDRLFETTVYSLPKDGAISKPFQTAHGWHILKRLSRIPVTANKNDDKAMQAFREKVEQNDRVNTTKEALSKKIVQQVGISEPSFRAAELWSYTDSTLNEQRPVRPYSLSSNSSLLQLGTEKITLDEWIGFAQNNRYKRDGSGVKVYPELFWNEFIPFVAQEYYKQNLEEFNPSFKAQIEEFKDGNLFFEIMQREIWGPAQTDTAALEQYYQQHKAKYVWTRSADAVLFYASDVTTVNLLQKQLAETPQNWKELVHKLSDKVAADSGRFELASIPNATKLSLKKGTVTAPLINKTDNTVSFAYIIKIYTEPSQRSFEEAKGMVATDYQAELEKKWIEKLKEKYPVTVNQRAWSALVNKK